MGAFNGVLFYDLVGFRGGKPEGKIVAGMVGAVNHGPFVQAAASAVTSANTLFLFDTSAAMAQASDDGRTWFQVVSNGVVELFVTAEPGGEKGVAGECEFCLVDDE